MLLLLTADSRRAGLQPPTSGQRTDTAVMDACRLAMFARSGCARWQVPGCVRLWAVNQWEVLLSRLQTFYGARACKCDTWMLVGTQK